MKGFVLEVDLEYLKKLHKLHNDYSLALEKIEIKREILSEYQLKVADLHNIPIGNVKKLVHNLFDKESYVIYYENLKLYLRLGIKLKKIHHGLEFNQSQRLRSCIEFNTQRRIAAEKNNDRDGKALHKLINNAIYTKTMENLRNRIDVKLLKNKKDYLKCTSKPSYISHKIFDNNLVAIRKGKLALKLNKPAYIGMFILELSKVLMYEFHYDYIKNKYDNKSNVLFTDTDSLMFEIKTEDIYEDFSTNKEMFDFSKSEYYDNSKALVIRKMHDETGGVAIEDIVGLKPKIYSFLLDNSEHKKRKRCE